MSSSNTGISQSFYKYFMIIVLMGYMGSGKSFIGKKLADVLGYQFCDLDTYISDKEGTTISHIFNNKGEIYFRRLESTALNTILQTGENMVLSLGGGTPCYGNNLQDIKNTKNLKSFYLKASIPVLANRLIDQKAFRPMISHLTSHESIIEFIGKHLFERSPFYSKSDYTIITDYKNVDEIIEQIVVQLV